MGHKKKERDGPTSSPHQASLGMAAVKVKKKKNMTNKLESLKRQKQRYGRVKWNATIQEAQRGHYDFPLEIRFSRKEDRETLKSSISN